MSQEALWPEAAPREPEEILEEAVKCEGCPIRRVCLISGGHDSTVLAHRTRELYDELAFIDTGTGLPGVREFVQEFAGQLAKPLRILEAGDAFRDLVLGDRAWWSFFRRERGADETVEQFVIRTTPARTLTDGYGNAPQGFPGPGRGGHRAAYMRLKERQIERLVREIKAEQGAGRRGFVALLTGARKYESRRRSMTQGVDGFRRKGGQFWINPLNEWRNEQMRRYRLEAGLPESDVAALLHRSGECNCGAYLAKGELDEVRFMFPDWYASFVVPLEQEARDLGIPRHVWGERTDSGRPGARGYDFDGSYEAQLRLLDPAVDGTGQELCATCATTFEELELEEREAA